MCLGKRLSVGQMIEIGKNMLPVFLKTARVCWVREITDGNYLAGLEFCPASR